MDGSDLPLFYHSLGYHHSPLRLPCHYHYPFCHLPSIPDTTIHHSILFTWVQVPGSASACSVRSALGSGTARWVAVLFLPAVLPGSCHHLEIPFPSSIGDRYDRTDCGHCAHMLPAPLPRIRRAHHHLLQHLHLHTPRYRDDMNGAAA